MAQQDSKRCPACDAGMVEAVSLEKSFDFKYEGDLIPIRVGDVPAERCGECREVFFGPDANQVEHDAICRTLGLLQSKEIKAIREQLGLTTAKLASLTGIAEATIVSWERGRLMQSRAMDRFLRLLSRVPDSTRHLQEFALNVGTPAAPPVGLR